MLLYGGGRFPDETLVDCFGELVDQPSYVGIVDQQCVLG